MNENSLSVLDCLVPYLPFGSSIVTWKHICLGLSMVFFFVILKDADITSIGFTRRPEIFTAVTAAAGVYVDVGLC